MPSGKLKTLLDTKKTKDRGGAIIGERLSAKTTNLSVCVLGWRGVVSRSGMQVSLSFSAL